MRAGVQWVAIGLLAAGSGAVHGADQAPQSASQPGTPATSLPQRPVRGVTPVFSQQVAMTYPAGFVPVFQNVTPDFYLQESVPAGQTVEAWTQMITLTGTRDSALGAADYLQGIGNRFQQQCPNTYRGHAFGKVRLGEYEGHAAFIGCGRTESAPVRYEMALVLVVKGRSDVYTVQWAERGVALDTTPTVDEPKWRARFEQLMPIRLCDPVEGEVPPYPSCLLQR